MKINENFQVATAVDMGYDDNSQSCGFKMEQAKVQLIIRYHQKDVEVGQSLS